MAEEKKEIPKEDIKPATTTPQAAAPANVPAEAAPAPKTDKAKAVESAKKEKPSNCASCNKSIKKKRYYYRSGKYYCTKRCWKTALKKEEKKAEETPASSA